MSPSDGREDVFTSEAERHEFGSHRPVPVGDRVVEWLTIVGERAGNALVDSSTYLAFISMVEVAIAMVVLALPPSPAPIVIALLTFAVYTNDHLSDDPGESRRTAFVDRYRGELYTLAALSYGIAITLAALGGPATLLITLFPGVVWILYASGRVPGVGLQIRRLKETFLVNSSLVALAWAVSLTFLPLTFADGVVSGSVALVLVYFFLRSFVDTEIPNVRDESVDRAVGVSTLPVVVGVGWTRRVLYGIDGVTAAIVGYAAFAGLLPDAVALALLVGVGYSLCVVTLVGRSDNDELLALAAEFEYVVVGLALVPVVYGL